MCGGVVEVDMLVSVLHLRFIAANGTSGVDKTADRLRLAEILRVSVFIQKVYTWSNALYSCVPVGVQVSCRMHATAATIRCSSLIAQTSAVLIGAESD